MGKKCKNNGNDDFFKFFMLQKLQDMEKMAADTKTKVDQIGQALGLGFNQVAPQNAQAFGQMLNGMPQLSQYGNMITSLANQRATGAMLPAGGTATGTTLPNAVPSTGTMTGGLMS